jgi:hypothetical protein
MSTVKCYILTPIGGVPVAAEYQVSIQRLFAYFYSHSLFPHSTQPITQQLQYRMAESSDIAQNRYQLAHMAWKDPEMTHILWIDADMQFPHDTLHRLINYNLPIVGANYPTRNATIEGLRNFTAMDISGKYNLVTTEMSSGLEKCSMMGFGLLLIQRAVFEEFDRNASYEGVKIPWFSCGYSPAVGMNIGEDWNFCISAQAFGFDIFVDHDLSKEVGHVGKKIFTYADV